MTLIEMYEMTDFFCPSHILQCQTRLSCIIQGSFDSLFCPYSSNYMQCSELLYLYWISLKPVFSALFEEHCEYWERWLQYCFHDE